MIDKKKVIDLFQSKCLLFPETEKEIKEFELFNAVEYENPVDWDYPEAILKRGVQKIQQIRSTSDESLNNEIEELKMVARKGNNLPQHIIDKMKANHKRNDK